MSSKEGQAVLASNDLKQLMELSVPIARKIFSEGKKDVMQACQGKDIIVTTPMCIQFAYHMSEYYRIPLIVLSLVPFAPTNEFPHLSKCMRLPHLFVYGSIDFVHRELNFALCLFFTVMGDKCPPGMTIPQTYDAINAGSWQFQSSQENPWREELGLAPISNPMGPSRNMFDMKVHDRPLSLFFFSFVLPVYIYSSL